MSNVRCSVVVAFVPADDNGSEDGRILLQTFFNCGSGNGNKDFGDENCGGDGGGIVGCGTANTGLDVRRCKIAECDDKSVKTS